MGDVLRVDAAPVLFVVVSVYCGWLVQRRREVGDSPGDRATESPKPTACPCTMLPLRTYIVYLLGKALHHNSTRPAIIGRHGECRAADFQYRTQLCRPLAGAAALCLPTLSSTHARVGPGPRQAGSNSHTAAQAVWVVSTGHGRRNFGVIGRSDGARGQPTLSGGLDKHPARPAQPVRAWAAADACVLLCFPMPLRAQYHLAVCCRHSFVSSSSP